MAEQSLGSRLRLFRQAGIVVVDQLQLEAAAASGEATRQVYVFYPGLEASQRLPPLGPELAGQRDRYPDSDDNHGAVRPHRLKQRGEPATSGDGKYQKNWCNRAGRWCR